jgi:hypothetical protein
MGEDLLTAEPLREEALSEELLTEEPGDEVATAEDFEEEAESLAAPTEGPRRRKGRARQRHLRRGRRAAVAEIPQALARAVDPTVTAFETGEGPPTQVAPELAAPVLAEQLPDEADYLGLADSVAASELVADSFLADEAMGPRTGTHDASEEPALETPLHVADAERADVEEQPTAVPEPIAPPPSQTEADTDTTIGLQPTYSSEWDEPDWIAEEDLEGSWEQAAIPVGDSQTVDAAAEQADAMSDEAALLREEPVLLADEGAPLSDLEVAPHADVEALPTEVSSIAAATSENVVPMLEAEPGLAELDLAEPEIEVEPPTAELAAAGIREAEHQAPEPSVSAESDEEELMWLGDEFSPERAPWSSPSIHSAAVSAAEDQALARLAAERGWDEDELRAIRSLLQQPESARPMTPEVQPAVPEASAEPMTPEAQPSVPEAPDEPMTPGQVSFAEEEALDWEQGPAAWAPEAPEARIELPGATELDEALAALEAPPTPPEATQPATIESDAESAQPADAPPEEQTRAARLGNTAERQTSGERLTSAEWSKPSPPERRQESALETGSTPPEPEPEPRSALPGPVPQPRSAPPRPTPARPAPLRDSGEVPDDDWLHGRRGPAANAYRRLRRLFPG